MDWNANVYQPAHLLYVSSCTKTLYNTIQRNKTFFPQKFDVERFTGNVTSHPTLGNHSIVHVYFNALTCIKYRRDIFMTWDGLLSKCESS